MMGIKKRQSKEKGEEEEEEGPMTKHSSRSTSMIQSTRRKFPTCKLNILLNAAVGYPST